MGDFYIKVFDKIKKSYGCGNASIRVRIWEGEFLSVDKTNNFTFALPPKPLVEIKKKKQP